MGLRTREEEKRFPMERDILAVESSEGTKEEDNSQPQIPPQTTARGPIKVEVLPNQEKPERRLAKTRKVVTDDEEDLMLEVRRAETEIEQIRQSRTRARAKRKATQGLVITEASDSSVEKTVASIIASPEVVSSKSTQPVVNEGPSAVLVEVPTNVIVEPSKGGTEMIVAEVGGTLENQVEEPGPPSPEEEVRLEVRMKTSGEEVKTLEITFPDFL
ncbi:hypothetical protein AXG93_2492s1000 [Marchantia polymorpha subsp. ruderalis]|uniref:Uncharacterized protein n=1 Tax=Marchantia polymorpha subsp. ruderalis TaxID=1480154 RepID=A0A176WM73_MARPO|nr:hypothetical protein AXG93_2492s1000 [Marchantia polymorpha subsp. ruderalis]